MTETPSAPGKLTERALQRVKQLADGNGIAAEQIRLVSTTEAEYTLPGSVIITLQVSQAEKKIKGLPPFRPTQMTENPAQLQELAQGSRQNPAQTENVLRLAADQVRQLPGYGWGQNDRRLELTEMEQIFCCPENCPACGGSAQKPCANCHGQKTIQCSSCFGSGQQRCPSCNGSGRETVSGGETQICNMCQGRMHIPCRLCNASGLMSCPRCGGRGNTACAECDATGTLSTLLVLKYFALVRFQMNLGPDMPDYVQRAVSRIDQEKLAKELGRVEIAEENPESGGQGYKIDYQCRLPFARPVIALGDKTIEFSIFGLRPAIAEMPPFLDQSLKPALSFLEEAAKGHDLFSNVMKACEFRAIRSVFEKAGNARLLAKMFPMALSQGAIKNIFAALKQVKGKISYLPGMISSGIAVLLSLIIFMLHFFNWRQMHLPFQISDIVPLGVMLPLSLAIMHFGTGLFIRWQLKRARAEKMLAGRFFKAAFGKMTLAGIGGVLLAYALAFLVAWQGGQFSL